MTHEMMFFLKIITIPNRMQLITVKSKSEINQVDLLLNFAPRPKRVYYLPSIFTLSPGRMQTFCQRWSRETATNNDCRKPEFCFHYCLGQYWHSDVSPDIIDSVNKFGVGRLHAEIAINFCCDIIFSASGNRFVITYSNYCQICLGHSTQISYFA